MKIAFRICFLALFFAACNIVYLEKPVPQSGEDLKKIPVEWSGVFEMKEPGKDSDSLVFKQCLRMERINETQLFISGEIRFAKKDLPALKRRFTAAQNDRQLVDFQITNRFIYSSWYPERSDKSIRLERQITSLVGEGDWYVLANSIEPLMLIDLEKNTVTKFDKGGGSVQENDLTPEADSLSMTVLPLVFRQKQQTYFLNMQPESQKNWLLYAITATGSGKMTVKVDFLKDKSAFEKRLDVLNKITPFQKTGSDYTINPTDEALDQLLDDPDLFETGYLVKIGEE